MKNLVLLLTILLGINSAFAQGDAIYRLEMPVEAPLPGEDFFVGLWLDVLEYPEGLETIKSSQIGLEFNQANVTAVSTGPPFFRYYYNANQMLIDYSALPATALPNAGDLRAVFYTTNAPGMDPQWYGGVPIKLWDFKFHYIGGDICISFSEGNGWASKSDQLSPPNGILYTIPTKIAAWDNTDYNMYFGNACDFDNIWIGNTSDWTSPTNWSHGNVPSIEEYVIIPVTSNDPFIDVLVNDVGSVTIQADATLYINDSGALTVNGIIHNDGSIVMYGNDNLGASLIDAGFIGTGTFEYHQTLATGVPGTNDGWHYVSSPVNNTVSADFVGYWVKSWNEADSMFMNMDSFTFCSTPQLFTIPMELGLGFSVKQDIYFEDDCPQPTESTGDTLEFGGAFMSGFPINPTIQAGMENVNTGLFLLELTGNEPSYNLIGNPYPSAIDWDLVTIPDGMNGSIYYWDDATKDYIEYVGGLPIGANIIQPTNGFFVLSDGSQPIYNLEFNNSIRVHDQGLNKEEVNDYIKLVAIGNGLFDETYIRFTDEATIGWDRMFDAVKMISPMEEAPSIYTYVENNMVSINSQPNTELIPMAFTAGVNGSYTIEAFETSEFANLTLEDVLTGETTDLLTSSYTFEYMVGEVVNRFIVHFGPFDLVGKTENKLDDISFWSSNNNIYVNIPFTTDGDIVIINMIGQEVSRTRILTGINVLPIKGINNYYVVKVIGNTGLKTEKVYLK